MRTFTRNIVLTCLAASSFFIANLSFATTYKSGEQKVQLVELFSSQGCSSCPPAQRWLNTFNNSPELWNSVVPVVFHVDYWDYLGWKDPYSSAAYSKRQRQYKRKGLANSVYTPGFFVEGNEWTGFFRRRALPQTTTKASELSVTLDNEQITASYANDNAEPLSLNIAVLGMNLSTQVQAGENRNRRLDENFIVLDHFTIESTDGNWQSAIKLPDNAPNLALAAWVTRKGSYQPLQATGGPIN